MRASEPRCVINAAPTQNRGETARRHYETIANSSPKPALCRNRGCIWVQEQLRYNPTLHPNALNMAMSPRSCESPHPSPHLVKMERTREEHARKHASIRMNEHTRVRTPEPVTARHVCVCSRGRDLQVLPRVAWGFVDEVRHRTGLINETPHMEVTIR